MNLTNFNVGDKLNILLPSEVYIKEKNFEYVLIDSSISMTEIKENGTISLYNTFNQLKLYKGESKRVTLALTDYKSSVTLEF